MTEQKQITFKVQNRHLDIIVSIWYEKNKVNNLINIINIFSLGSIWPLDRHEG